MKPRLSPRARAMLASACAAPDTLMRRAASNTFRPSRAWSANSEPYAESVGDALLSLRLIGPVMEPRSPRAVQKVRNERGAVLAYRYRPTPAAYALLGLPEPGGTHGPE